MCVLSCLDKSKNHRWLISWKWSLSGMRACAILEGEFKKVLSYIRVYFWDFALQKGPFLAPKVPYNRVLFCSKLKFHPVFPTSKVNFFSSLLNHTFCGTFCLLFLKFAFKRGQIFSTGPPHQRMGFEMLKWHTRIQKSVTSCDVTSIQIKFSCWLGSVDTTSLHKWHIK